MGSNESDTNDEALRPVVKDQGLPPLPENEITPKNEKKGTGVPRIHLPWQKVARFAIAGLIVALIGFAGGWLAINIASGDDASATDTETQRIVLSEQGGLISSIAEQVGQSVVSVNVTTTTTVQGYWSTQDVESQGAGTGVILSEDGLILTNRHVVPEGTTDVGVVLSDGTELDAEVVARTAETDSLDVAFLQITDRKGHTLKPATLGVSSDMRVGDPVIAIGNALGQFQNTVTTGIISGYGRSVQASSGQGSVENLDDLFQTDAAINSGNSGGPLVNVNGQVIAINTAVATDAENIGFAIPIDNIKPLIASVQETGKISRPFLGVVYISVTDDIAKQEDLAVNRGAYIPSSSDYGQDTIVDGSPADKAGVHEQDVITKVDDITIDEKTNLGTALGRYQVGDTVTLTINRDGKTMTVKATLTERPEGQ